MSTNVILVGRISHDLELKKTNSDKSVLNFKVACRNSNKETVFIPVTAWETNADNIYKYSGKGKRIYVQGEWRFNTWEKDGTKHQDPYINLENYEFCDPKPDDDKTLFEEQFPEESSSLEENN